MDYGQLRNTFMNKQLSQGFTGCRPVNNQTKCGRDDRYQDNIPRNFGFSFGFMCRDVSTKSLKGLSYSLTINDQSNDTECEPIPDTAPFNCTKYYNLATFPNLLDQQEVDRVAIGLRTSLDLINPLDFEHYFIGNLSKIDCYQHLMEVFCFLYFPKCDSASNIMIPPCKESITKLQEGSKEWLLTHLPFHVLTTFNPLTDYLPSKNGSVPCFYKPVICSAPPKIHNGEIIGGISPDGTYFIQSDIKYKCKKPLDKMHGSSNIACLYSKNWSSPPYCKVKDRFFCTMVIVSTAVAIIVIIHQKQHRRSWECLGPETKTMMRMFVLILIVTIYMF